MSKLYVYVGGKKVKMNTIQSSFIELIEWRDKKDLTNEWNKYARYNIMEYVRAYHSLCSKERKQIKHELVAAKNNKFAGHYLYKFLDENDIVIYVGKSSKLYERLTKQHFTKAGHLKEECYKKVKRVLVTKLDTKADQKLGEFYFINLYKPQYNTADVVEGTPHSIPYFDQLAWSEFNKMDKQLTKEEEQAIYNKYGVMTDEQLGEYWHKQKQPPKWAITRIK